MSPAPAGPENAAFWLLTDCFSHGNRHSQINRRGWQGGVSERTTRTSATRLKVLLTHGYGVRSSELSHPAAILLAIDETSFAGREPG